MSYLFSYLWVWLLLSVILGIAVGALSYKVSEKHFWPQNISFSLLLFFALLGIGIILAATAIFPDRTGLWFDTALMVFTAYLLGCFLGSYGRSRCPLCAACSKQQNRTEATPPETKDNPSPLHVIDESAYQGKRPESLQQDDAEKDDLKLISGIAEVNETKLNELGIWRFSQIAAWTPENIEWVGHYLAFPGRIEREDWVGQAKELLSQKATETVSGS